jgi:nucleotide-binding universal stress UspA family protein
MRKILFPVDLSSPSVQIVPKVLEMAEKLDAEIHLLAVAEPLGQYAAFHVPHPSLGVLKNDMAKGTMRKLEDFQMEHLPDYTELKLAIRVGEPAEQILDYIRSSGIDMVMMATQSLKGLSKVLFGSVAEKVVKNSPVPVMTASRGEGAPKWEMTGTPAQNLAVGLAEKN